MSNTKHTPGPWKAQSLPFYEVIGDVRICVNAVTEEFDFYWYNPALVFGKSREEAEANAKVIAAAPELLEALLMCVNAVGALADKSEPARNAWNKATAAIKKATE